eukprot:scaffold654_cov273-Prasinococcus_capsulatus_cf.AAC.1
MLMVVAPRMRTRVDDVASRRRHPDLAQACTVLARQGTGLPREPPPPPPPRAWGRWPGPGPTFDRRKTREDSPGAAD